MLKGPPSLLPKNIVRGVLAKGEKEETFGSGFTSKDPGEADGLTREAGENSGVKYKGGSTNFGVVGLKDNVSDPHVGHDNIGQGKLVILGSVH